MRAKIEAENRIYELQKLRKENKRQKYLRNFGGLNAAGAQTEEAPTTH
jgi:hypothetical protein